MSMPAEIACHSTGHHLESLGCIWNYVGATITLCIPGACVVSNWPPPPWGQLCKGPMPPKLEVLVMGGDTDFGPQRDVWSSADGAIWKQLTAIAPYPAFC